MSNNLYKAGWVVCHEDDTRIIDSNKLIAGKIESRAAKRERKTEGPKAEIYAEGFSAGIVAPEVDALLTEDGETAVIHANASAELEQKAIRLQQEQEQLKEEKNQIEQMKQAALNEVSGLRSQALEEGRQAGYEEGYKQGLLELEALKQECLSEKQQQERDYEIKITELEPLFVEHLTAVYEHVFGIELSRFREVTEHLLTQTLLKIEGVREFLVHVSTTDYPQISADKTEIMKNSATTQCQVDIIEDISLQPGECLIETGGGIFDCSLGTEIEELTRKLRVLSFQK